jgi:hypothetical protein
MRIFSKDLNFKDVARLVPFCFLKGLSCKPKRKYINKKYGKYIKATLAYKVTFHI